MQKLSYRLFGIRRCRVEGGSCGKEVCRVGKKRRALEQQFGLVEAMLQTVRPAAQAPFVFWSWLLLPIGDQQRLASRAVISPALFEAG